MGNVRLHIHLTMQLCFFLEFALRVESKMLTLVRIITANGNYMTVSTNVHKQCLVDT